jgi:hypothetical protein
MAGVNIGNQYASALSAETYRKAPKTVLAAIAVSALTMGGDYLEEAEDRLLEEWAALHAAGIVPQSPPARVRA